MLEYIVVSSINSLLYGLLLFMLSSGLTLIFSMMGVLNFAHASFFMLGAYFAFQISEYVGFWPGLVVAPLIVGALGAMVERYGLRIGSQVRPCGRTVVYRGAGLSDRRRRQSHLGAECRHLQNPGHSGFPLDYFFRHRFFCLPGLYAGHLRGHVRPPVSGPDPEPHRTDHPGGPDPPGRSQHAGT